MGIEAAVAIMAVATVASVGMQYQGAQEQKKAAKAAAADRERARKEQQEANEIANAAEKAKQIQEKRRAVREARVRRASILQNAQNSGVAGSSGETGAVGTIGTNLGTVIADSTGRNVAIQGINSANQNTANYLMQADNTLMKGRADAAMWDAFAGAASGIGKLAGMGVFNGLFDSATTPADYGSRAVNNGKPMVGANGMVIGGN